MCSRGGGGAGHGYDDGSHPVTFVVHVDLGVVVNLVGFIRTDRDTWAATTHREVSGVPIVLQIGGVATDGN